MVYGFVLRTRYGPQHRLDAAADTQAGKPTRRLSLFHTRYWTRRERVVLFLIILVAWYVVGLGAQATQAIFRTAGIPIQLAMGSFAGPVTAWELETQLPSTPERDLLLAISYQQSGETEIAARLYRRLPQLAESWNNLGVILKNAGKDQEARQAFARARSPTGGSSAESRAAAEDDVDPIPREIPPRPPYPCSARCHPPEDHFLVWVLANGVPESVGGAFCR